MDGRNDSDLARKSSIVSERFERMTKGRRRVPTELDRLDLATVAAEAALSDMFSSEGMFENLSADASAMLYDDALESDPRFAMGVVHGIILLLRERDRIRQEPFHREAVLAHMRRHSDVVRLLETSDRATVTQIAETLDMTETDVAYALAELQRMGVVLVSVMGRTKTFELTTKGTYLTRKMNEENADEGIDQSPPSVSP